MPLDLAEMLDPSHTAVLTMELQNRVVGEGAALGALAENARATLPATADLLAEARSAGIPVVHCVIGPHIVASAPPNYPLASALAKRGQSTTKPGDDNVVPAIRPHPTDYVVSRHHGVAPFTGTELDAVLRRLNVRTIVATGVSLNVGIVAVCIEAVNLNYRVVVATDCVAGADVDYGRAVLANTIAFLATRLSSHQIAEVWRS